MQLFSRDAVAVVLAESRLEVPARRGGQRGRAGVRQAHPGKGLVERTEGGKALAEAGTFYWHWYSRHWYNHDFKAAVPTQ